MTSRLSELFVWKDFTKYEPYWDAAIKECPELLKATGKGALLKSDLRVGIEVEVENIRSLDYTGKAQKYVPYFWGNKPDNSLRDAGCEFVSMPIYGKYIIAAVNILAEWLKSIEKQGYKPSFSDLCGLHVHLNVREFTVEGFANFCFVYSLFEATLFRISGERSSNIFCVPMNVAAHGLRELFTAAMTEVDHNRRMNTAVAKLVKDGHKYTALNLKPIKQFGTVEFRHAASTGDPVKLLNWINIILHIAEFARKAEFSTLVKEVSQLNTNSEYEIYARKVFGDNVSLFNNSTLWKEMGAGVSSLKNWCIPVEEIYVDDEQARHKGKRRPGIVFKDAIPDEAPPRRGARIIVGDVAPAHQPANPIFRWEDADMNAIQNEVVPPINAPVPQAPAEVQQPRVNEAALLQEAQQRREADLAFQQAMDRLEAQRRWRNLEVNKKEVW
jgi:hypothetical protein